MGHSEFLCFKLYRSCITSLSALPFTNTVFSWSTPYAPSWLPEHWISHQFPLLLFLNSLPYPSLGECIFNSSSTLWDLDASTDLQMSPYHYNLLTSILSKCVHFPWMSYSIRPLITINHSLLDTLNIFECKTNSCSWVSPNLWLILSLFCRLLFLY